MFKYIRQRIALAILALFIISILCFTLVSLFGPNPAEIILNKKIEGVKKQGNYEALKIAEEIRLGLRYVDGRKIPILVRYFQYIGGIFHGDFKFLLNEKLNPNPSEYTTMSKLFFQPLKYSIMISLPAFVMSAIIGITFGTIAGYQRGKWADSTINVFVLFFIAVPSFIIAPIAITIAAKLNVAPNVLKFGDPVATTGEIIKSYLPPIIVVTLGSLSVYTTYTRNQVVTVLTSNYILIAKTKGLSGIQIYFKYVLRNISIPLSAIIIPSFVFLLSGSIIVEKYWQVPGTSTVIANSFPQGEIYVVMFSTLFFSFISLASELVVDILFVILDPRITYGTKSKRNLLLFLKAYFIRRKLIKELKHKLSNSNSDANLLNAFNSQEQASVGCSN